MNFPMRRRPPIATVWRVTRRETGRYSPAGFQFRGAPMTADRPSYSDPADSDPARLHAESRTIVAGWLLLCGAMVAAMVVIGGVTRLTESGLSMTEWRPLIGALPPLTDAEWQRVFDLYRQTSEYRLQNAGMDLAGFKTIFWWEYIHRLWGRLIGLVFGVPLLWFLARGRIGRRLAPHLIVLFFLGMLQGVIGWWMVTSGFADRDDVSQYRLTVHLGLAIAILGYLLWLAFDLLSPTGRDAAPKGGRWLARALVATVFLTILSGGLVAGLNAGLIYNSWPLMDGALVPRDVAAMAPGWINLFENRATVQFDHRMMAYATAAVALTYWIVVRRGPVQRRAGTAANWLGAAVILQIVLGISTLLLVVPQPLAVLHQAGAVAVFVLAIRNAWALSAASRLARADPG